MNFVLAIYTKVTFCLLFMFKYNFKKTKANAFFDMLKNLTQDLLYPLVRHLHINGETLNKGSYSPCYSQSVDNTSRSKTDLS